MEILAEDFVKILLAILAGGLIGIEREFRDKAAGFRTLIFICLGSALFSILSSKLAISSDPTRIATGIVTGVGFLGAGVIMREGGRVTGLTTAATIWLTAAIGMGIGGGQYLLSGATVLLAMIVLWIFPSIERHIEKAAEDRNYEIVCVLRQEKMAELEELFKQHGLKVREHQQMKTDTGMVFKWQARGSLHAHEQVAAQLFEDADVRSFKF